MNAIKLFDYDKFVVKQLEENEDSLKKKKKKKKVINKKGKMLKKKRECERGRNRE